MKSAVLMLLCLVSCTAMRTRQGVLVPAIEAAWPGVRADAQMGNASPALLVAWDSAVRTANFVGIDAWEIGELAKVGIDVRLLNGEIGPNGAVILYDRTDEFVAAVEEMQRLPRRVVRDTPLVISRSSWKNSPPPAIAGDVYR